MSNRRRRVERRAVARANDRGEQVYPVGQEHLHRGDADCRCRPRLEEWTIEHVTIRRVVHSELTGRQR